MKVTKMSVQQLNFNNYKAHRLRQPMQSLHSNKIMGKDFGLDDSMHSYKHAVFKGNHESNINNQINTTTGNNYNLGGRVSFSGDPKLTFAEKVVNAKWFKSFCEMAKDNSAVAEAVGALFITCGMRPLTIMAMPQKDVDKNRKAASHSIASGVTGLIFAKIAYEPFSAAMKKIKTDLDKNGGKKYLGSAAEYLSKPDVTRVAKNGVIKKVSNYDCFNQLITYGPKVFTSSILAAFTVGTMPYIDKYIIDKYILKNKPKPTDKPVFTTYDHFKFVTFKRANQEPAVFQSFKGVMK